jgi:hypothetical protein
MPATGAAPAKAPIIIRGRSITGLTHTGKIAIVVKLQRSARKTGVPIL